VKNTADKTEIIRYLVKILFIALFVLECNI
jgi:hypothetical protein